MEFLFTSSGSVHTDGLLQNIVPADSNGSGMAGLKSERIANGLPVGEAEALGKAGLL